ncbi:MAG: ADOP family duplicated permease, partial [Thermoanaerobaculia bacterium]|nr:ADOP family duplicated permease [Thermoanaerobaculia bacterium]
GVMPHEFSFPYGEVKAWVVIQPNIDTWDRGYRNFMPVVRLADAVEAEQVQAQLQNTYRAISERHYADYDREPYVTVEPIREALMFLDDMIHPLLGMLTVASLFVLLIICTNIANLFLVRATSRQREVAVRAALGAGRLSLVRQLLAEGLVLALAGGGLGVLLAHWLMQLVGPVIPEGLYRVGDFTVDTTVLAFSLVVSVATVLIFALPPALQSLKTDLNLALKEGSAGAGTGVRARRAQSVLVTAQIALAVVLLVSTALAVRSFANMDEIDPGFEGQNVLTMGLLLPSASFGETTQVADFHDELLARVEALPGVESAALTAPLPMNFEQWSLRFEIEGREDPSGTQRGAALQYVSPGYFGTTGISLLAGRDFEARDGLDAPRVAVINQTMAQQYWPEASPLGERLRYERGDETVTATIVGVVEDTKRIFLNDESDEMVYLSQTQYPYRSPWLLVETTGDPLAMTPAVRESIWSLRDQLPLSQVRTLEQVVDQSLQPWSWSALVLGVFSIFALLLASIGIYGVVAYAATQRTTEIGIRMAMGAQPRDVMRFVMGKALLLTAIGVGIGTLAALALNRAMASMLYGIGSADPLAYLVVLVALGTVTLVAALGPARRAARTDPSLILHYE